LTSKALELTVNAWKVTVTTWKPTANVWIRTVNVWIRTAKAWVCAANAWEATANLWEATVKAWTLTAKAWTRAVKRFFYDKIDAPQIKLRNKEQLCGCSFYLFTGKLIQRIKKVMKKVLSLMFVLFLSASFARAQTAEVSIQLNEKFFDALLDAIFKNASPPEFPIAGINSSREDRQARSQEKTSAKDDSLFRNTKIAFREGSASQLPGGVFSDCPETIRLQREIDGVKTAVRLRDGKINAPLAFTGSYNPPLIGCIDFSGVAETTIDLEFDRQRQALVGRATVSSVNLSGAGGIGSSVIAGLVQGSIDRKINPIEIIKLDKISFVVPIQNSGSLKMKATGIKTEVVNGAINVRVQYEFN
jgi:hypothetical protein